MPGDFCDKNVVITGGGCVNPADPDRHSLDRGVREGLISHERARMCIHSQRRTNIEDNNLTLDGNFNPVANTSARFLRLHLHYRAPHRILEISGGPVTLV